MSDREVAEVVQTAKGLGYDVGSPDSPRASGWSTYLRDAALGGGRVVAVLFRRYVDWRIGQDDRVVEHLRSRIDALEAEAAALDQRLHHPLPGYDAASDRARLTLIAAEAHALEAQVAETQRKTQALLEIAHDFLLYIDVKKATP